MEAWSSIIQKEISMSTNLVILGRPPSRALFNVKSRTLRVLTMMVCWWRLNVVTMATPLLFFIFFSFFSKMWGHTQISRQDMNWEGNLLWGTQIPPRHLEFAKLQVYGVQVSFSSCSSIKTYRGVVVGVALMFVVLFIHHSSWSSPRKVSDRKYPKDKYILEHALAFLLNGK